MSADLDQTCPRTACADLPPHRVGRHRDPRDQLYDGPHGRIGALHDRPKRSAHRLVTEAPELMPEVMDLVNEIHRLGDTVAHLRVDADRRERRAMLRSQDCAQHGQDIEELGIQLHQLDATQRRTDSGRVALLGMLNAIRDSVQAWKEGWAPETTVAQLMERLDTMVTKASAAHDRAWKR